MRLQKEAKRCERRAAHTVIVQSMSGEPPRDLLARERGLKALSAHPPKGRSGEGAMTPGGKAVENLARPLHAHRGRLDEQLW